jgi:hypothetical protein
MVGGDQLCLDENRRLWGLGCGFDQFAGRRQQLVGAFEHQQPRAQLIDTDNSSGSVLL